MTVYRFYIKFFFTFGIFFILYPFGSMGQIDKEKITIGEYRTIYSRILNEQRRIWVHLPKNYSISNQKYPVIYKCDPLSVASFAGKVRDLNSFDIKKNTPEMILVSIENTDRQRDMFPIKYKSIKPGADKFLFFIQKELIPFVEKNYRAEKYRILMGESNSALFTIFAMLKKPEIFNGYIASSPELSHSLDYLTNLAKKNLNTKKFKNKKLYLIYGNRDHKNVTNSVPKFITILEKHNPEGFKWVQNILENEGHVPESSFKKGLIYIFEGYLAPKEIIKKGASSLKKYYKNFNIKMGFSFKPNSYSWYQYALYLLRNKKKDQALKLLTKIHNKNQTSPFSLSILTTIARIYLNKKKINEAIIYYQKAKKYAPAMNEFFKIKIKKLKKKMIENKS